MPDHLGLSPEIIKTLEVLNCLGIFPQQTLIATLDILVSYSHYRPRDTGDALHVTKSESVNRLKLKLDTLFPYFKPFEGTNPIRLIHFLYLIRNGFEDVQF